MKRLAKAILMITTFVLVGWTILTFYVEQSGPRRYFHFPSPSGKKALIAFDADPFYNLDEQICVAFAESLNDRGYDVNIITTAAVDTLEDKKFDLFVYCANTYNWRPDWAMTGFIKKFGDGDDGKPVVAITLGAGSTSASKKHFEKTITEAGGMITGSYELWLWRPNDEERMNDRNVLVATDRARGWAAEIAEKLNR